MYKQVLRFVVIFAVYGCDNPFGTEKQPEPGPVVFTSNMGQKSGNMALFTMNEDGSNLQRLTNDSHGYVTPRWSPDGKKLVFNSTKNRTNFEALPIFIMDVTNGSVKQIADQGWNAVWSRDGKKLAYTKDPRCGGYCSGFDIHLLDLETGVEKNVWETPNTEDYVCDWGVNGETLLISSFGIAEATVEDNELYFLDLEDGSLLRLTDNEVNDSGARLSPDGLKIVYSSFTGTDWDLFVMDADGGNKRNLTNDDKPFTSLPAWSPDGARIVFTSSDGPGLGGALSIINIYVIRVDGTGLQKLTNGSVKDEINDWPDWRWR